MSVLAVLISGILHICEILLTIFIWMIVARSILSWINPYSRHPVVLLLIRFTDPLLWKIRRRLPMPRTGFDLSPVFAILLLLLARYLLFSIRVEMALRF